MDQPFMLQSPLIEVISMIIGDHVVHLERE